MRRPTTIPEGEVSALQFYQDSPWVQAYPHLFEFLVDTRWEDGTERETGTLLLFAEAGRLKACLNDRALGRSVFLSAESLESLFSALQAGLADESLDWRSKAARTPSKGR